MVGNGREVVVVAGVRTAIGTFGGSLKDVPPIDLGALMVRAAVSRAGLRPDEVGSVFFGHVINTEPRDMYLSSVTAVEGGLPHETPCANVNRLCGSGSQAILSAAKTILLGDADVALAGGAESMSRSAYIVAQMRWGARMGDAAAIDMMTGALHDPFLSIHMGMTAENVAVKWEISRADQDALAVESHSRAVKAIASGHFKSQIVPVELRSKKGSALFDIDEHARADVSVEKLAGLRPVFKKDGSVTAGNASGLNDGAAALVLMERSAAEQRGVAPMARLVSYAHAGVDRAYMGIGLSWPRQRLCGRRG